MEKERNATEKALLKSAIIPPYPVKYPVLRHPIRR